MSLIKKFQLLNNLVVNQDYYKLLCLNKEIGYVHKEVAREIIFNIETLTLKNGSLYFLEKKNSNLSSTAEHIANLLIEKKKMPLLSKEMFSCKEFIDSKEFFKLDRSLVEMLGIRGYGVHLIAYIKKGNNYKIWVPKRNRSKLIDPLKLDNTVAGGVKAGENIYMALQREAKEEAGIKKFLLNKAKLTGTINYSWKNKRLSIRRDTLYLFDLEVDTSFLPKCYDGEVEKFKLMDWEEVLHQIQETNNFKTNCALVLANFLIRHGLLTNKNEKKYEEILRYN